MENGTIDFLNHFFERVGDPLLKAGKKPHLFAVRVEMFEVGGKNQLGLDERKHEDSCDDRGDLVGPVPPKTGKVGEGDEGNDGGDGSKGHRSCDLLGAEDGGVEGGEVFP